ncbi:DNA polymerase domain-containing protein [Acidiphilium sp.]|jgi:DNA polymerase I|uniref:DNA polymerase domain-containing protein n=1 Tax=Acidiphilium sp. TaxID=527 RepID=UPI0025857BA9|nr:DNA polymerase domain-containing protein [Acidiphilium sp.]MCL4345294.1 DNA polymerase I [Candidatus Thermoplasmatota archaeon]
MSDTIVNCTLGKTANVWFYGKEGLRIERRKFRNSIFVTGDEFDLDFLCSQLDLVNDIDVEREQGRSVYGSMDGLRIYVPFRWERDLIRKIRAIGSGRKFRIYNGLINGPLKFMSTSGLTMFETGSVYDHDPNIPALEIDVTYSGHHFVSASINNLMIEDEQDAVDIFMNLLPQSVFFIYGSFSGTSEFLRKASFQGSLRYSVKGGNSYSSYGQVHYNEPTLHIPGKICISASSFMYREGGLHGIMEISRISGLPPETVSMCTPGTAVSSMEIYEALKSGIMPITDKDDHEDVRSVEDFIRNDHGGFVMQPRPGVYRNVAEIDFSSMYPSIMHHFNLSPETINRNSGNKLPGENPYYALLAHGFIPQAIGNLLKRRLIYKNAKKWDEEYAMRDRVLKWLLLTSFGYTGFKNARFGKIEMHEAITSIGRWALERAMRICEEEGFTVIHGIVDSLFIQGNGSYSNVLRRIRDETSINIVMDGYYRWMVFLPARSGLGALNRYFGMKENGEFKVRGIAMRRGDYPEISSLAQEDALSLMSGFDPDLDMTELYSKYRALRNDYMNMNVTDDEIFRIRVRPSRYRSMYSVNGLQKSVMGYFEEEGREISPGESVYVVVNDYENRVFSQNGGRPDRKYYAEIMKRTFEPFDFAFESVVDSKPSRNLLDFFH